MSSFTKDEQWDHNYDFFLVDDGGKIGHFSHVGFRFLPPSIAKSKENLETITEYFQNISFDESNYSICSDLNQHLDKETIISLDGYIKPSVEMSSRGLFSYDSYNFNYNERPYFRVTLPKNELLFSDLPDNISTIMKNLRLNNNNFLRDSLIPEATVANL